MSHFDKVMLLEANKARTATATPPCKDAGVFRIMGMNFTHTPENHRVILQEIMDDGHRLLVRVAKGKTGSFVIENTSDPLTDAEFTYKHKGQSKKRFKSGEVISSPETHILTWETTDLHSNPIVVTLTLIPIPNRYGLRVLYTFEPAPVG